MKTHKYPGIVQLLLLSVSIIGLCKVRGVLGHGMMLDPPNRSSIWRFPEFKDQNATENWADNGLYCGSIENHHIHNAGNCGICGDNFADPMPRANEDGGVYGQGIIVRKYNPGDTLPIVVNLTASHWGWFEIHLCAENSIQEHLTETCYNKHILDVISESNEEIWKERKNRVRNKFEVKTEQKTTTPPSSTSTTPNPINSSSTNTTSTLPENPTIVTSTKQPTRQTSEKPNTEKITEYFIPIGEIHPIDAPMQVHFKVQLPKGITCQHCVLRWQYTTGSNWGICDDGFQERGCGPQETFRNCADIAIT